MNDNERCSCRGRNDTSTLRGDTTLTRCGGNGTQIGNGSVLIDVNQVFDSCRDRDCFEDTRVFLDEASQALIEHTGQVRTRTAEICSSSISVDPVQLSRGFFRVTVRSYFTAAKAKSKSSVQTRRPTASAPYPATAR